MSIKVTPLSCPTCHSTSLGIVGVSKEGLFLVCLACDEEMLVEWEELEQIIAKVTPKKGNGKAH